MHIYSERNFSSRYELDRFVCSPESNAYGTVATACSFSNKSSWKGQGFLAAATNEGIIHILCAEDARRVTEVRRYDTTDFQNRAAIFDIGWSDDDSHLAVATGGKSAYILDIVKESVLCTLEGHGASQKVVRWSKSHRSLLTTGGRDGNICVWDERVQHGPLRNPVIKISRAHSGAAPICHITTVTDLTFPTEHSIYSSGASDAIMKYWDLRSVNAFADGAAQAALASAHNPIEMTTRPRGLQAFGDLHTDTMLALARDSAIYAYSRSTLTPTGHSIRCPTLHTNSAYASLSVSPCGRWAAAGGTYGDVIVVNVEKLGSLGDGYLRPAICELKSDHGEVNAISWSQSDLATASDDGTVRLWRTQASRL